MLLSEPAVIPTPAPPTRDDAAAASINGFAIDLYHRLEGTRRTSSTIVFIGRLTDPKG